MQENKNGVIYILTNPSFPDYIKIGYADNLQNRLDQLNRSSAVPFAFRAYAVYETPHRLTDIELHKLIDTLNPDLRAVDMVNGKKRTKEFYIMPKEDAYSLLESIARISGTEGRLKKLAETPQEKRDAMTAEAVRQESKRPNFTFDMIGVKEGEEIYLTNDPSKKAMVIDNRHVEYEGVVYSLTGLAKVLLHKENMSLQGPSYFSYHGRALNDIRNENEQ